MRARLGGLHFYSSRLSHLRCFWVWQLALTCLLWLSFLEWPLPPVGELDPSWQQATADAWLHQRQFGDEFVFTWGPWGFLLLRFMLPGTFAIRVAFEIIGKLALAAVFVQFASALSVVRGLVFLAIMVVLGPIFPDSMLLMATVALLVYWVPDQSQTRLSRAMAILGLAFLSLVKFSNTLIAAVGMALAAGRLLLLRRYRAAAGTVAVYAGGVLLLWVAAGQGPTSLPAFVTSSLELSNGYSAAMSLEETWPIFLAGAALLVLHSCWLALELVQRPDDIPCWPTLLILAASIFLAWKHGFTRADGHVMGFFIYSMLIVVALPALLGPHAARLWWPVLAIPIATGGLWMAAPQILEAAPLATLQRIEGNLRVLFAIDGLRPAFDAGLAANEQRWRLPLTSAAVGEATIDVLGYEQGIAQLNHFNYAPRPVPQSYATYTAPLLELNRSFLASPEAPTYFLAAIKPVDGRYPTQDDASLLAELPRRYEPLLSENDYVLVKRREVQPPPGPLPLTLALDLPIRLGEEFDLPSIRSHALWLQVDARLSIAGRLRAAVYKAPQLIMTITPDSGAPLPYRLIPSMAESGFIVQPLVTSRRDLEGLLLGQGKWWARSIKIDAPPSHRRYWRDLEVHVSRIDSLPLTSHDEEQTDSAAGGR